MQVQIPKILQLTKFTSVNLSQTTKIRFKGGGSGTYGNNIIKRISGDGSSFNISGFSGNSVSFNNGDFTTNLSRINPIKPGTSTTIRFTYSVNTPPPPPPSVVQPPSDTLCSKSNNKIWFITILNSRCCLFSS